MTRGCTHSDSAQQARARAHSLTHSLTQESAPHAVHGNKRARNETLQLCVCAAVLVFRVSSGRLVRRLSPVPDRPPYPYNAEDLPDQPHFSRSLERCPSGTVVGPYCSGYRYGYSGCFIWSARTLMSLFQQQ